jgi:hypothetical protein
LSPKDQTPTAHAPPPWSVVNDLLLSVCALDSCQALVVLASCGVRRKADDHFLSSEAHAQRVWIHECLEHTRPSTLVQMVSKRSLKRARWDHVGGIQCRPPCCAKEEMPVGLPENLIFAPLQVSSGLSRVVRDCLYSGTEREKKFNMQGHSWDGMGAIPSFPVHIAPET